MGFGGGAAAVLGCVLLVQTGARAEPPPLVRDTPATSAGPDAGPPPDETADVVPAPAEGLAPDAETDAPTPSEPATEPSPVAATAEVSQGVAVRSLAREIDVTYRSRVILADLAAATLVVFGGGPIGLAAGGVVFVAGAPLVHAAEGNPSSARKSLAMRLIPVALVGGLALAISQSDCQENLEDGCFSEAMGTALLGLVATGVVLAIDWTALPHKTVLVETGDGEGEAEPRRLTFGVVAGANTIGTSEDEVSYSEGREVAGAALTFRPARPVALRAELAWARRWAEVWWGGAVSNVELAYLELPLLAQLESPPLGSIRLVGSIGGQVELLLGMGGDRDLRDAGRRLGVSAVIGGGILTVIGPGHTLSLDVRLAKRQGSALEMDGMSVQPQVLSALVGFHY